MFIRKYWLPLSVFLVLICAVGLYYLQTQPPKEPILITKLVEPLEKPTTAEVPEGETSQDGHRHADGTWHEGAHAEGDRPVLPPLRPPETPKFVKPVSDTRHGTIADKVKASGTVPDRATLEAMSDEKLSELMDESYEKARELSPKWEDAMSEWAKVVGDLTRQAKTRAENDAILAEHADTVQPLREAMESVTWEYQVHSVTGHRASKILSARFYVSAPDFIDQESLTDEFWTRFWSDF